MLTIPWQHYVPYLPPPCAYIKGQLETGASGFLHWQLVVRFSSKTTLASVKRVFGDQVHVEPTRSEAALAYVHKDDTAVAGTRFELGSLRKRGRSDEWEQYWALAKSGNFEELPGDVRIRYYGNLRRIHADYSRPIELERTCNVYWGNTGLGKSRLAWEQAGLDAYPKDPRTKWWCGYRGQSNVVIDEFRGDIDIAHLLRWLDRYPVNVETKGSSVPLSAKAFWITSNVDPRNWFPTIDPATLDALLRRIRITHFDSLNITC